MLALSASVPELLVAALYGDLDFRNGEFEGEHSGVDFLSVKISDNKILDANIEKKGINRNDTYMTWIVEF